MGNCPEFVDLLNRLRDGNDPVRIVVNSGADCCEHIGCIGEIVNECYITLISSNDVCVRTYIPLDCICAVVVPPENGNNDVNG